MTMNMAKMEFDLQELYRVAFGYVGLPFPMQLVGKRQPTNAESGGNIETGKPKIFETSQAYNVKSFALGKSFFMPVGLNKTWLPNNPMLGIECRNNIVYTSIAGNERGGTVKEFTGQSDYQISIKGFCIDFYETDYPKDDVRTLHDLFKLRYVSIENELTDLFGIKNVVIESLRFPEIAGKQNVQPFEMTLISDDDFTVLLED
jgi:hypothetical protein